MRVIINNAFKQKRDFNDVTATMHLYDAHHKLHTVDVMVDGHLKRLGYHPYMLLKVKDVTMPGKE